ncbi:hypothetical protein F5I97DRAFT_1798549 [Phlebopus sp. FC_14]|nr:hypothetical protein F5I97DRAFT_1798549 [Phlebopus sp. FC_14]
MPSNRISALLHWCAENGVRIDPRIQVVDKDSPDTSDCSDGSCILSDGRSDYATVSRKRGIIVCSREHSIEHPCTLVHIPKAAVLSVRSCSLTREITTVPYGHDAHLALALALYGELLRGSNSRWSGYLQSLPRETVDIAMFWGVDNVVDLGLCTCSSCAYSRRHEISSGDQCPLEVTGDSRLDAACTACARVRDGQSAKEWLKVTEAERVLINLMDEIHQYYFNVVELTLRAVCSNAFQIGDHSPVKNGREPDFDGRDPEAKGDPRDVSFSEFCHAYSLVSSRAFWVDAYHGLAMVPIADA